MPTAIAVPLRERKRLATWQTLHEVAASLALTHESLSVVTVDSIVELANVSPRTFFNYFGTKEDAILGFSEPAVSAQALEAFTSSAKPLANRVADFYFDVMASSRTSGKGRKQRIKILSMHPELTNRQVTHFSQVELLVHEATISHLGDAPLPSSIASIAELVDVLVFASSYAYRIAARRSSAESTDQADRVAMHHALSQLREVTQNA